VKTDLRTFDTSSSRFIDLTNEIAGFVSRAGRDGLVNVFVPHATAGLAIVETGSGTEQDLEATVDRLLPRDDRYVHSHGSPGHGADHVLPAFLAPSLTVPVIDGEVQLGTWQSIVLVDTNRDNPQRQVRMSFMEA
jgi:secondary thiamine-phosphate synthase enzyme